MEESYTTFRPRLTRSNHPTGESGPGHAPGVAGLPMPRDATYREPTGQARGSPRLSSFFPLPDLLPALRPPRQRPARQLAGLPARPSPGPPAGAYQRRGRPAPAPRIPKGTVELRGPIPPVVPDGHVAPEPPTAQVVTRTRRRTTGPMGQAVFASTHTPRPRVECGQSCINKVAYFFFLGTLFVWSGLCIVDFPIQSGPADGVHFCQNVGLGRFLVGLEDAMAGGSVPRGSLAPDDVSRRACAPQRSGPRDLSHPQSRARGTGAPQRPGRGACVPPKVGPAGPMPPRGRVPHDLSPQRPSPQAALPPEPSVPLQSRKRNWLVP